MITNQYQARGLKRYKELKQRAEASDLAMKHLGTRRSAGENTDIYFDNIEFTGSPWKTIFYNIFTMAFDAFLYLAAIAYFWTPEAAFWTVFITMSGATAVMGYLLITKILETLMMIKLVKANRHKEKTRGYLDALMEEEND